MNIYMHIYVSSSCTYARTVNVYVHTYVCGNSLHLMYTGTCIYEDVCAYIHTWQT